MDFAKFLDVVLPTSIEKPETRAPIVRAQNEEGNVRVVAYDDNSHRGKAVQANQAAIYGKSGVGESFGRRNVIEVIDPESGVWTPVNQANPGAPMGAQIAALSAFQQTGLINNGNIGVTSDAMPGANLGYNFDNVITTQGLSGQDVGEQEVIEEVNSVQEIETPERSSNVMMDQFARAISTIESGSELGDYGALGDTIEAGSYKGDRAYGRYQVMGRNIGEWTKEALGVELSPDEFLKNPDAQDAVFETQFQKNIDKYGSPQDAASVWFTGRPMKDPKAAKASDGNMTGGEYVEKFNALIGTQSKSDKPEVTMAIATNKAPNQSSLIPKTREQNPDKDKEELMEVNTSELPTGPQYFDFGNPSKFLTGKFDKTIK